MKTTTHGAEGAAWLTPDERRKLLEEIGHLALTLGCGPSPTHSSASPAHHLRRNAVSSPFERLHLLLTLWQQLEPPIRAILLAPDNRITTAEATIPLARLRGTRRNIGDIARNPRIASGWFQRRCETPVATGCTATTNDTDANRMLVSLLQSIAIEADMIARLATLCSSEAILAQQLATTARQRRAHSTLRECPSLNEQNQMTGYAPYLRESLTRCSPPYRVVAMIHQQLYSPLDFDWTNSPLLSFPALEPWHLYEIWCFLQVAVTLMEAGWQLEDRGEILRPSPTGLRLTVATGRASRLRFRLPGSTSATNETLTLAYQPLFVSANRRREDLRPYPEIQAKRPSGRDEEAFCSRSHAMQPDMAIYYRGQLILLDPKFKRFVDVEEILPDIDKMHTYRDAICYKNSAGRSEPPAVAAAWCLFPGTEPEAPVPSPVLYAYPSPTPSYPYGTAGVGAFCLRPGDPTSRLRLRSFLDDLLDDLLGRQQL